MRCLGGAQLQMELPQSLLPRTHLDFKPQRLHTTLPTAGSGGGQRGRLRTEIARPRQPAPVPCSPSWQTASSNARRFTAAQGRPDGQLPASSVSSVAWGRLLLLRLRVKPRLMLCLRP